MTTTPRILSLAVLLVGLPVALYLVLNAVRLWPKAQGVPAVRLFFSPSPVTLPPNRNVELRLDSGSERIVFVHAEFTFNSSKVRLSGEITPTSQLGTVVEKTTASQANSSGRVVVALALDTAQVGNEPTGNFLLATIPLSAVSSTPNDQDTFRIATSEVVNSAAQALSVLNQDATLNLNTTTGGTLTPVPTSWTTGKNYQLLVGDVNDSNTITIEDIAAVLVKYTDFSVPVPSGTPEDVNADGTITIEDVALVLLNYVDFTIRGDTFP